MIQAHHKHQDIKEATRTACMWCESHQEVVEKKRRVAVYGGGGGESFKLLVNPWTPF